MVHVAIKFCPQVPPMRQGKKFTSLLNVRVNQLSISQKCSFWCWYCGWFDPPPSPPILGGDGSYGYQILPTSPPHETRKKIAPSVRLKSQTVEYYPKIVILGVLPRIVWHPPTPPKLGGDGSCGYQILPTSHSHETGEKMDPCDQCKSQTVEY